MPLYKIDDIINNWKIISILGRNKYNAQLYECECICENKTIRQITEYTLKKGRSKSCGCLQINKNSTRLLNQIFENLLVISLNGKDNNNRLVWDCVCICGNTCKATTADLISGHVKSCGHLKYEPKTLTHGMSKSPEYYCFYKMKQRCSDPNHHQFINYGARGISVCERWLDEENGFINFIQDMGLRPKPNYSIERLDNNKGYEPSNCKWATSKEQNRNNRNVIISSMDEANEIRRLYSTGNYTYSDLADIFECSPDNIGMIVRKQSWT